MTQKLSYAEKAMPLYLTSSDSIPGQVFVGKFDFGRFSPLQISTESNLTISRTFVLQNLNKTPVTLEYFQLHPLIHATLLNRSLPCVLGPRDQIAVDVELDTIGLQAGKVQKSIEVFLQGQSQPAATLQMIGTYVSPVAFLPTIADFGTVFSGTPKTIMVQIMLDPQLMPIDHPPLVKDLPHLSSSDPDIRVTILGVVPLSGNSVTATPSREQGLETNIISASNAISYRLTLSSQAKPGMLRGQLLLMPIANTAASIILKNVSIPINGRVVTAAPSAVAP